MRVYIKKELKEVFNDEDIYLITLTKGEVVIGGIALYNKKFKTYSFSEDFTNALKKNNIKFVEFLVSLYGEKEFVEPLREKYKKDIKEAMTRILQEIE